MHVAMLFENMLRTPST